MYMKMFNQMSYYSFANPGVHFWTDNTCVANAFMAGQ